MAREKNPPQRNPATGHQQERPPGLINGHQSSHSAQSESASVDTDPRELFPYEKIYYDADDKARLHALPQLRREVIFAERYEQVEKAKQDRELLRLLASRRGLNDVNGPSGAESSTSRMPINRKRKHDDSPAINGNHSQPSSELTPFPENPPSDPPPQMEIPPSPEPSPETNLAVVGLMDFGAYGVRCHIRLESERQIDGCRSPWRNVSSWPLQSKDTSDFNVSALFKKPSSEGAGCTFDSLVVKSQANTRRLSKEGLLVLEHLKFYVSQKTRYLAGVPSEEYLKALRAACQLILKAVRADAMKQFSLRLEPTISTLWLSFSSVWEKKDRELLSSMFNVPNIELASEALCVAVAQFPLPSPEEAPSHKLVQRVCAVIDVGHMSTDATVVLRSVIGDNISYTELASEGKCVGTSMVNEALFAELQQRHQELSSKEGDSAASERRKLDLNDWMVSAGKQLKLQCDDPNAHENVNIIDFKDFTTYNAQQFVIEKVCQLARIVAKFSSDFARQALDELKHTALANQPLSVYVTGGVDENNIFRRMFDSLVTNSKWEHCRVSYIHCVKGENQENAILRGLQELDRLKSYQSIYPASDITGQNLLGVEYLVPYEKNLRKSEVVAKEDILQYQEDDEALFSRVLWVYHEKSTWTDAHLQLQQPLEGQNELTISVRLFTYIGARLKDAFFELEEPDQELLTNPQWAARTRICCPLKFLRFRIKRSDLKNDAGNKTFEKKETPELLSYDIKLSKIGVNPIEVQCRAWVDNPDGKKDVLTLRKEEQWTSGWVRWRGSGASQGKNKPVKRRKRRRC